MVPGVDTTRGSSPAAWLTWHPTVMVFLTGGGSMWTWHPVNQAESQEPGLDQQAWLQGRILGSLFLARFPDAWVVYPSRFLTCSGSDPPTPNSLTGADEAPTITGDSNPSMTLRWRLEFYYFHLFLWLILTRFVEKTKTVVIVKAVCVVVSLFFYFLKTVDHFKVWKKKVQPHSLKPVLVSLMRVR